MKKYGILISVLVLTAALMTGCRRPDVPPTELPSTQGATMMPTTEPTTAPTTLPTTEAPTDMTGDATGGADENGLLLLHLPLYRSGAVQGIKRKVALS